MILSYVCDSDAVIYRVSQMDPKIGLLGVVIRCPKCQQNIAVRSSEEHLKDSTMQYTMFAMSAEELFRASNGLGLPNEQNASMHRVAQFVGGKLVDIRMDDKGGRVIVETISIQTDQGVHSLYFGSSTKGAIIYRIVKE